MISLQQFLTKIPNNRVTFKTWVKMRDSQRLPEGHWWNLWSQFKGRDNFLR